MRLVTNKYGKLLAFPHQINFTKFLQQSLASNTKKNARFQIYKIYYNINAFLMK